ncbi:hypothetical protein FAZ69_10805 [Trinickia terrae]|uniref:Lipoprotein n=1 Tax=Trinickia terrae TaxID=2571161 RepID=A0A4U1I7M5_9BURK|nr:hypothetical protein [Trinickia terrae]TKC89423.1 hypothetical protein FAZ69_10805 [Trinickia terrae]
MRLRTTVTLSIAVLSSIGLWGCGPDDSASPLATPAANAQQSAPNVSQNASADTGTAASAAANSGTTNVASAQSSAFPAEPAPVAPVVHYAPESSAN